MDIRWIAEHFSSLSFRENMKAMKRLTGGFDDERYLEREWTVLTKLNHPHVVRYCDYFVDQYDLFIVIEYCEVLAI